ncbi:glycosyltransferase family 8 protein [Lachnospiraceae bacterium JLR.KK008]
MMSDKISVAWGIDKNYILQAFVVMKSILMHSGSDYDFHILSGDEIGDEIKAFEKILKMKHHNFSVTFHRISAEIFSEAHITNSHLSLAAYNRLLIPEILTECKRCIYLDCDIIVNGDLRELYDYKIDDNYVAGVRDNNLIVMNEGRQKHMDSLGLPSMNTYINSGVLVMNLDRLRKDNIVQRFLLQSQKDNLFEDQDVINVCCYGSIGILPLKYNLFHFYSGRKIKTLFDRDYQESDFDFDWNRPFILHMGGHFKPWISMRFIGAEEWWSYADDFSESKLYRQYKDSLDNNKITKKMNVKSLPIKMCGYQRAFIWGYTKLGKEMCDFLGRAGLTVDAILDNNHDLSGKNYKGIDVILPLDVKDQMREACILVAVIKSVNKRQVTEELRQYGVKDEQIVLANEYKKDILYYMSVDSRYYKEVLEDIMYYEQGEAPDSDIFEVVKSPNLYPILYYNLYKKYYFREWLERC